jgi:CARDB/Putative Ig domain
VAVAVLAATSARAQTYVATTVDGVPYPALTAASPVTFIATAGTPEDRGRAQVPLGFTFPFYDRLYTQLTVTANGVVFFEPSSALNLASDFPTNILGSVAEPNGVIAPFWDDLEGNNPSSVVQTQNVTGANGNGLAIEFKDWNRKFGTYLLNFQVRLWSNGVVELYFGGMTGTGSTPSASCGIEAPGTAAVVHCPCASNNNCTPTDLPNGRRVTFGPSPGPDLLVRSLQVDAITPVASDLQITTTLKLRNFGTTAASNFTYRLYASDDTFYSPGTDVELLPTPHGPLSINPLEELTSTVSTTVPAPTGAFYLLAVIDDANVVVESNEFNNLAATPTPFFPGVDLVAQAITGPPLGGPGEPITNNVRFSNQGVNPAGSVNVKVWLSLDSVLGTGDLNVHTTTLNVAGGQNVNADLTYPLPTNVPAGNYFFILQLDDGPAAGAIAETIETNNVAINNLIFTARQADLVIDKVSVREPSTPFGPAPRAFFGEPIRVQITVRNQGGATAPNVSVLAFLSDNDTLNAITDTFVGEVTGLSLSPGQSLTVDVDQPVPTLGSAGQTLPPAPYFFFGAAVGQGLVEVSGTNNFLKAAPINVRNPAPDLTPLLVTAPAQVGQGEKVVVTRTLANIGNRPAPQTGYRYYLSANQIITPDDTPVPLVAPNGTDVDLGSVTLGVGERSVATEIVRIPSDVGLATWYLGVLVDPNGAIDEVDKANNGFANQQVQVLGRGLSITTSALPSAVLDAHYEVALAASGGDGTFVWEARPGTLLPPGFTLSSNGRLFGTPTSAGAFAIDAVVKSAGLTAEAVLTLRVAPVTGSLGVATTRLPMLPRLLPWLAYLSAVGGRAPYTWTLASGTLPAGIGLDPSGKLAGTATQAAGATSRVVFRVADAVGNADERAFDLVVVEAGTLKIQAAQLPLARLYEEYAVDVLATQPGGLPLAKPLTWGLAGRPPEGLALSPSADERLLLSGAPREAGTFTFLLEVEDALGRRDVRELVLTVVPPDLHLTVDLPEALAPGDGVLAHVQSSVDIEGATFRVRDGVLPEGLTLSENGTISGALPKELAEGVYVFTVSYQLGPTELSLRSVALNVNVADARRLKGCGCGSTSSGLGLLLLLAHSVGRRRSSKKADKKST